MNKPVKILITEIRELIIKARSLAYHQVNTLAVMTNFEVGRIIVDHEQAGNERAPYGKETLKVLSKELIKEFGAGYSVDNLQLMRSFSLAYYQRVIPLNDQKSETLSRISQGTDNLLFKLSWSHYVELIKMDQPERKFYEVEAVKNNWSIKELRRQYNSSLFERVALSKNKDEVLRLTTEGQIYEKPSDLVKQPYILEFLGLKEQPSYSECQLEQAIIDKIKLNRD